MLDYFQTGAFLRTSKETTLRGVLQNNFVRDIRINDDVTLRGSDTVQSILTFGASVTAHPPLGQNAITSAMPTDPVAGERVGRHGAIEPSG
jgi:hypothetical protein